MAAPYKPREAGSLKQAVAQLVEACGGQKVVAGFLSCSAQHVVRMTDDDHPKTEMRLGQVLLLQGQCGQRIVTEYLAAEQGCIVEQLDLGSRHHSLPIILGRVTSEMGELLSAAAKDVQGGTLTATNAATVLDETDDVVAAVLQLRAEARATLARKGRA